MIYTGAWGGDFSMAILGKTSKRRWEKIDQKRNTPGYHLCMGELNSL